MTTSAQLAAHRRLDASRASASQAPAAFMQTKARLADARDATNQAAAELHQALGNADVRANPALVRLLRAQRTAAHRLAVRLTQTLAALS